MKKVISLFLSLMMLLSVTAGLGFSAYADDLPSSGSCGDDLIWSISDDKVLSISGSGVMYNYSLFSPAPWEDYIGEIEVLVLPDEMESIGNYAFKDCTALHCELDLPSALTRIGSYAFEGCAGLKGNLIIPEGITTIEEYAFNGCTGFRGNLTLPSTLTEIKRNAFKGCKNLKGDINLPSGLTEIGNSAFEGCAGLTGNLVIPDGVTTIGSSVFRDCSSLNGTLTLPDILTSIGNYAFENCSLFNGSLVIPDNVKTIGNNAFECCSGFTGLVIGSSVTTINSSAFRECTGFTGQLLFPTTVSSIGVGAFYNCSGFTGTLIIPLKVYAIGEEWLISPFEECTGFQNIVIHSELAINSDSVFSDCKNATFYVVEGSEADTYIKTNLSKSEVIYLTEEEIESLAKHETALPEKEHSYGNWVTTKEPNCTETGLREKVCVNCGNKVEELIDALGHDWEDEYTVVKDATCTEDGYKTIHCRRCNEEQSEVIPKGHKWDAKTQNATCTEDGYFITYCSVCGILGETRVIAAKGHSEVINSAIVPSCTVDGKTAGSHCSVCGEIIVIQDTIPATGHTEVIDPAIPATYTAGGKTEGKHCSVCGTVIVAQKTIAKLPKKPNALTVKVKNPTVKFAKLKKKNQTVALKKAMTVSNAQGTLTFKKSKGNKKITVAKNGKITVKKGLKKGTYKVKIQVTAAGNNEYNAAVKTVTIKIKVK